MRRLMVRWASLLMFVAAVSTAAFAWSQPPDAPPAQERPEPTREGPGFRPPAPPLLEALDSDKDQELAAEEIERAPQSLQTLDKNSDAALTNEELMPVGGRMFGGPGRMGQTRHLLEKYDKDRDGQLNAEERAEARKAEKEAQANGQPAPGRFGPGFGRQNREPPQPGPRVAPEEVPGYPDAPLYEPTVLRTIFLEFENAEWEAELADFKDSDVEIPATMIVDGKPYLNVGVQFRGMSSFGMVPAGYKRSFNISMDFVDPDQRLYGYKTLNLLNSNGDPSFLSSVLYSHIARKYMPAPKANLVKVVINGESWGVFANVQQFNKEFLVENYETTKGTRWKVRGSPGGGGGLEYVGDDVAEYKKRFEIKSKNNEQAWKELIALCKTLNETPPEKLEQALQPMLDLDETLWFLALDVVLCNSDGYWVRASDYSIFQDKTGVFHFIPHDMNEAFHNGGPPGGPRGPGRRGGPGGPVAARDPDVLATVEPSARPDAAGAGGENSDARDNPTGPARRGRRGRAMMFGPGMMHGGVDLDPLIGLDDARKPLRSKLLAVPSLKAKYLRYVRTIASDSLDWQQLGPVVKQYRDLIEQEVAADTRKLSTLEAFQHATSDELVTTMSGELNLRTFVEKRREYLLNYSPDQKPASDEPLAGGPPAGGGPGGPGGPGFRFVPPPALMEVLDADADGKLSASEWEQSVAALKTLDENTDGKLDQDEIGWPPFRRGGFPGGFGPAPPGAEPPESQPPAPVGP